MVFIFFISFIILLRIAELILSRRNEIWLLQNDAIEYGKKHYPFIVVLHVSFLAAVIIEYATKETASYNLFFIALYFLLLAFKCWIIFSLGKFWNTKIYRMADVPLIQKGPYKYFKHPNYFVVIAEIAIIPLSFYLYFTAIIFSLLNALILIIRIREENKALKI